MIRLADLAKHLSNTAKVPHPWNFYHDQVGWNDRLPNINAALGCSQIEKLNDKLKLKKGYYIIDFVQSFQDVDDIEIIKKEDSALVIIG